MSGNENPEDSNSPFPHRFNEFDVQDLFGLKLDLMFRHRIQEVFSKIPPNLFFIQLKNLPKTESFRERGAPRFCSRCQNFCGRVIYQHEEVSEYFFLVLMRSGGGIPKEKTKEAAATKQVPILLKCVGPKTPASLPSSSVLLKYGNQLMLMFL